MAMKVYRVLYVGGPDSVVAADRLTYDGTGALIFMTADDICLMIAQGHWKSVRRENYAVNGSKTPSE